MTEFWQSFWLIIELFFLFAYLIVLFHIVADVFRDRTMGGFAKAIWILFLWVVPVLTALVYLIARGRGMEERQQEVAAAAQRDVQKYIRETAGKSPANEIAEAKSLLEAKVITEEEYARLKAKALA